MTPLRKTLLAGGLALMLVAFVLSALDLMLLITLPVIAPALLFLAGVGLLVWGAGQS